MRDHRVKQSRAELRNILAREHKGNSKSNDLNRKAELIRYLKSIGMSLRKGQSI